MKLYNFAWGPYPRRLTHYLTAKHISDLELIEVEFPHQPKLWPAGFLLSLNPAHSLPVLETRAGVRIGQSVAILEYLEEIYTETNLLGETPELRAATRELVSILDEATTFFGVWARHGSRLNADKHLANPAIAKVGADRFASKIRVAEAKFADTVTIGSGITIADCIAVALIEFADEFYGVALPEDCPALIQRYKQFTQRGDFVPAVYPAEMLRLAYGLPDHSGYSFD